jgi:hypothetical protein
MGIFDLIKGQPQGLATRAAAKHEKEQQREDRDWQHYQRLEEKWAKKGIRKTASTLGLKELELDREGRSAKAVMLVDGRTLPVRLNTPNVRIEFSDRGYQYRKVVVAVQHQGDLLGRAEYNTSSNMFTPQTERYSDSHNIYVGKAEFMQEVEQSLREGPRWSRPAAAPAAVPATDAPALSALDEAVVPAAGPNLAPEHEL